MTSTHAQNVPAMPPIRMASEPCATCGARSASVCSVLEEEDLPRLAAVAFVMRIEPDATFIAEGSPGEHFFNITSGDARLFKLLPDGRRQIIGFAGRGQFLGLAVSDVYGFSAEAIGPVSLCRFSRAKLHHLLEEFPALEHRLLKTASNELVAAQEQMLLLGRKTARERVASFLLARSGPPQACRAPLDHLHLPMTRGDIADYLGLTIETVSRTMTRLRADHLIALHGAAEVGILDRSRLESVAAGSA